MLKLYKVTFPAYSYKDTWFKHYLSINGIQPQRVDQGWVKCDKYVYQRRMTATFADHLVNKMFPSLQIEAVVV